MMKPLSALALVISMGQSGCDGCRDGGSETSMQKAIERHRENTGPGEQALRAVIAQTPHGELETGFAEMRARGRWSPDEWRLHEAGTTMMGLYRSKDVAGLKRWIIKGAKSGKERVFGAYLLNLLGEPSAKALLVESFPILSEGADFDVPWYLAHDEGCASAYRPSYCRDSAEMLVQAAEENWTGARRKLVEVLVSADGERFSVLCDCGIKRNANTTRDDWVALARSDDQVKTILSCFENASGPYDCLAQGDTGSR